VRTDFLYDVRDKLVEAKRGATIDIQYLHDAFGRLVHTFDDQGVKQYQYDDTSRLVEFYSSGFQLARYEYGDRLIKLTHQTEGQRFYSFDALGSPTALTDELGTVRAKYHLDAWGIYRKPDELDASQNRFGFTGYTYTPQLNLYYANARFYDPEVGRFTSQDSYLGKIDDPPSLHRYLYANDNPTRYTDPSGHCPGCPNATTDARDFELGRDDRFFFSPEQREIVDRHRADGARALIEVTRLPRNISVGMGQAGYAAADHLVRERLPKVGLALTVPVYGWYALAKDDIGTAVNTGTELKETGALWFNAPPGALLQTIDEDEDEWQQHMGRWIIVTWGVTATLNEAPVMLRAAGFVKTRPRMVVPDPPSNVPFIVTDQPPSGGPFIVPKEPYETPSIKGFQLSGGSQAAEPAAVAPETAAGRSAVNPNPTVASNDLLATPGRLQSKLAAWRRYQATHPNADMGVWSRQYDGLRYNYARGKWREWWNQRTGMGDPGAPISTPIGDRIPDAVDGVILREFKDGDVTFSPFIRRQMFKDFWLMRHRGMLPEWYFHGGASARVLGKLDTYGIPYFFK